MVDKTVVFPLYCIMINPPTTPKIYLSNKELLKEIHKSKLTYSWVLDPKYADYDAIVRDITLINNDVTEEYPEGIIEYARQKKADKRTAELWEQGIEAWQGRGSKGEKPKAAQFRVDPTTIPTEELVFRLMTFAHIPPEPGRKNKPKSVADHHTKINFPPFQHHSFVDDTLTEVARSHWKGDPVNGAFNLDHGLTNRSLAKMYIKLCDRYSMRSNWRGYTYLDEMRGQALLQLSQIGLQFDESKSDNPFAYYTAVLTNSFTRIVNIEKKNQVIRDDLLIETGQMPSFTRQLEHEYAIVVERERSAALKESEPVDVVEGDEDSETTEETTEE
jgi:hypothetical protein